MIQHGGRPRSESLQQVVRRILRASSRASAPVVYAAGAVFAQGVAAPAHADPALPTPCVGASCGTPGGNLPFVQSGMAGAATVGNAMTVTQSSDKAILNWKDFNIGAGHSVTFKQPANTSAALNRIWSATPSDIAGQLTANGQVYLINQSGIVFARGAQVNVGGLIASTLDLSDASFRDGLLSGNTDALKAGSRLPAVFDAGLNVDGTSGQVQVGSGAQITAADGGRVLLAGSSVGNKGSISTPDGQTILAAGQRVYLASTADPTMRGLLVEVDAGGAGGSSAPSSVTNAGEITAARGNVTLAGLAVNQRGILNATSSVSANGSIYLIAGDTSRASEGGVQLFYNDKVKGYDSAQNQSAITQGQLLPNNGGTLTLAPGSVTQITPDTSDTATINDAQAFYTSQINLVGRNINMMGNATVRAPGARVSAVAASNPWDYAQKQVAHTFSPSTDGSRIFLDAASAIDVSGLKEVAVAATRNIVPVRMGANELADDPLLRDGFLHGQTVNIDVTKGSTLLNPSTLKAYQNNIGRGIKEKLTVGGTLALSSNGDVITRAGSTQNVSGGSVAYQTTRGQGTAKLLGADGRVYDVTSAPNDIQYVSFADTYSHVDTRWGTTTKVDSSQQTLIAGYLQGADAGELDVQGPQIYLRGTMLGQVTPGLFQRSPASMPRAGVFALGDSAAVQSLGFTNRDAPSVVLTDDVADDLGDFDPLSDPTPRVGTTAISLNALGANGFNRLALYSNGSIAQAAGNAIALPGSGSLILDGSAITLDGAIRMPSSTLNFKAENFLATENLLAEELAAAVAATHPNAVTLGASASVDVRGTWVNDSPLLNAQPGTAPLLVDGGSVTLQAYGDVMLGAHTQIDASGAGWINASNKLKAGNGGRISLRADVGTPAQQTVQSGIDLGGATLLAEGLASGGKLSLTSAWVSVTADGKVPLHAGEAASEADAPAAGRPGELALAPDFFTRGGFSQYSITGINGVTLGSADGTAPVTLTPIQQNRVFTSDRLLQATGSDLRTFTTLATLPPELRAPTSLSFSSTASLATAPGLGNVTLNRGSAIVTDPGASVSLTARENLSVFGSIAAPAGHILLQLAPGIATTGQDDDGYVAGQQLLLGPEARLSARGFAAIYSNANALGYRQGGVLGGGSIDLLAYKGSVAAQLGSVLDVSAAEGIVDVVNRSGVTPIAVAGSAGRITVQARENLVLNSDLKALPASVPGAGGGDLTIGLDLFDLTSTLSYNNSATPDVRYPVDPLQAGTPVIDRNLTLTSVDKSHLANTLALGPGGLVSQDGSATISTSAFAGGGFANVTVRSADILTLDASLGGRFAATPLILSAKASVTLDAQMLSAARGTEANVSAAYVGLGTQNFVTAGSATRTYTPAAAAGPC